MPARVRPLLLPGAHPLRRHDGRLQVGLDPGSAVIFPPDDAMPAAVRGLDGSPVPEDSAAVALLAEAGLLVDERCVVPLLGATASPAEAAAVAALVRAHGDRAVEANEGRRRRGIHVVGFGTAGDHLTARITGLLGDAGLGAVPSETVSTPEASPALGLLVGVGEPERELVDDWMRRRQPHLVVRLTEGTARVGPYVAPGETACLRCIDAHHADADPTWPLLVRQYAAASRRPRHDGTPEPVDPLLATVALAWAARDAATWAEGARPSLWSTVLSLDPALREVESRCWTRHPGCGCSWQ